MRYKVVVARNMLTLSIEEVIVLASNSEEAVAKALSGDVLESNIVEVTDVAELGEEIESVLPEGEDACSQNEHSNP